MDNPSISKSCLSHQCSEGEREGKETPHTESWLTVEDVKGFYSGDFSVFSLLVFTCATAAKPQKGVSIRCQHQEGCFLQHIHFVYGMGTST